MEPRAQVPQETLYAEHYALLPASGYFCSEPVFDSSQSLMPTNLSHGYTSTHLSEEQSRA